jgi:[ribosomal protein S18]-alanine N-acetyltransferase
MSVSQYDESRYSLEFRSYSIEQMLDRDLEEVVAIEEITGLNRWGYDAYRRELFKNPDSLLLVARRYDRDEKGRAILGFIAGWTVEDELHVNNLASHPEYRGKGIGRSLMEAAVDEAMLRGAAFVLLEVRATNEAAQALYRKLGFSYVGRRRDYYRLPTEDAFVMKLEIR